MKGARYYSKAKKAGKTELSILDPQTVRVKYSMQDAFEDKVTEENDDFNLHMPARQLASLDQQEFEIRQQLVEIKVRRESLLELQNDIAEKLSKSVAELTDE